MNKDNVIAMEFLLTTKAGIKNNAMALIESTSDEIRNAIIQELQYLLNLHEEINIEAINDKKRMAFSRRYSKTN